MSFFVPIKRATILIPGTGPIHDKDRSHLFIVLTSPCAQGRVLTVSVSSYFPKCDQTCILNEDDHDFLTHKSFVFYARADFYEVMTLVERVKHGDVKYKGLISEKIFEKICDGLLDSKFTSPIIKNYFNDNAEN